MRDQLEAGSMRQVSNVVGSQVAAEWEGKSSWGISYSMTGRI